jgi:outer membrane protein assembly factor BamD (BamD/ComL family)
MKIIQLFVAALLSTLLVTPKAHCVQAVPVDAFSTPALSLVSEGDPLAANATDGGPYSEGTRAIHESRWSDAVRIFTKVASEQGEHSDEALYWKAYAENKQEHPSAALDACIELRRDHPKSFWIQECGALEIEIQTKNGKPIQPQAQQDDDLKLLALNSRMQQDELQTVPEIQRLLNGDLP